MQFGIPGFDDEQKRAIAATIGDVRIVNLYVVNGQAVGSEKYDYKLRWLDAVHGWLAEEIKAHPKLVVLGDFNIAPGRSRRARSGGLERRQHPHLHRRARCAAAAAWRSACTTVFACTTTKAGSSAGGITAPPASAAISGLRIDLVLVSEALRARAMASSIDREPRLWDRPSDHAPVWVEIAD